MSDILVLIVITDVVGLGIGIALLWGSREARAASTLRDLEKLILLAVACGLLAAVLALAVTGSGFAVLRLFCHVLFCVLAPLLCARGLHALWRKPRRAVFASLLIATALAMEGVYVWARHVEPYRLQVREYRYESELLDGTKPVRAVVLADLQTDAIGDYERRVFARIGELAPDLLLIPGDLLQTRQADLEREYAKLEALFRELPTPRLGIYMVDGDTDPRGRGLPGIATLLSNKAVPLAAGCRLQILGLDDRTSRVPFDVADQPSIHAFDGLTIVMGHSPDFVKPMLERGISVPLLCIAGHTHGGQVVVPGFGPPITLSALPREYAGGGLHEIGDATLIVSRGVGMERGYAPRIRFLCPPELVVIELRGGKGSKSKPPGK